MTTYGTSMQDLIRLPYDGTVYIPTIYGMQPEHLYTAETFDFVSLCGNFDILYNKRNSVVTHYMAFDIETTAVRSESPYAFMYTWQICLNGYVVIGTRWEQFMEFMEAVRKYYSISRDRHIVIYVHNLSYEFQFIKCLFEWEDVFLRKERAVLKAVTSDGLEFRCSYFLTNCSLELFLKNENCMHRKVKAEQIDEQEGFQYDYSKYRTPWTEHSMMEIGYQYNDVKGLYEGISNRLKEDTLLTIPLTSTGYVRRDMRNAASHYSKYKRAVRRMQLDIEQYSMCRRAFRGGDTHANYTVSGKVLEEIDCYDFSSSYPYAIMAKKFPMTAFVKSDSRRFREYMDRGKAMLFDLRLEGVEIKDPWMMPYISSSKCNGKCSAECRRANCCEHDNGRVLRSGCIILTVTDLDYKIIHDCYSVKKEVIGTLYTADYGYLPVPLRETALQYFDYKCRLKYEIQKMEEAGETGTQEYSDLCVNYTKSKNRLNGIYGMFATDPVMDEWVYSGLTAEKKEADTGKALAEHNSRWSTFLAYQWGIWVTAWARYRLNEVRLMCPELVCYNDTDSVYTMPGFAVYAEEYNRKCMEEIRMCPIVPESEAGGKTYYMGTLEHDGHYEKFITWGAKRYACIKNGKILTTVSGLSKKGGAEKLKEDGFEAFRPGWTVEKSGNMTAYYNDVPAHYIDTEDGTILSTSNAALFDSPFTLKVDDKYADLIGYIKAIKR